MKKFLAGVLMIFLLGCSRKEPIEISSNQYHDIVDLVTQIMVHDIFSPPVASRIYVYPNIGAYEIIAAHNPKLKSLSGQIKNLKPISKPKDTINYKLASLITHLELSKSLIFSEEKLEVYQDSLYKSWKNINKEEFLEAEKYAKKVIHLISQWMKGDNYAQTRTMPKFHINSQDEGRWQPTPPAYMDGIEPHWNKIRTMIIDSASQFKPIPPPPFTMDKSTIFYKELQEVYNISKTITEKGNESEEIEIAQFWDCNPYVSVNRGHLMFATKKITPGAHWIGICKIACKKENLSFEKTILAYTKTSIAIFDAFIGCWDEKYRSNLVRPETLINKYIDDSWKPLLQTPPFPEYTSGHSVISGSASVALTSIFGKDFYFKDDTETPYGLPIRNFASFDAAANEAAISRLYGGIHYRTAVEVGVKQGKDLGQYVVENLNMQQ